MAAKSDNTLKTIVMFAGFYLLLQGIINRIAKTNAPGKISALGVVGMQICYYLALGMHVTGSRGVTAWLYLGHFFLFIYIIAFITAIVDRCTN